MVKSIHDVIIIGAGPAGLTAAIYGGRAKLEVLVLEKEMPGGQTMNIDLVEDYPGYDEGIAGAELGSKMMNQAMNLGMQLELAEVHGIDLGEEYKTVRTALGDYLTRTIVIANGAHHMKLAVPGEEELAGRGVSSCAVCDGPFFRDRVVAVVGGGDVAVMEALFLANIASKVLIIHDGNHPSAAQILQARALANPKVEFVRQSVVESIGGSDKVEELALRNTRTDGRSAIKSDGVFVAVGFEPNAEWVGGIIKLGPGGSIPVSARMETEIQGIFAAGDVRLGSPMKIVSAVGDGATAALAAQEYLRQSGGRLQGR